jgi:hypothetical protein
MADPHVVTALVTKRAGETLRRVRDWDITKSELGRGQCVLSKLVGCSTFPRLTLALPRLVTFGAFGGFGGFLAGF